MPDETTPRFTLPAKHIEDPDVQRNFEAIRMALQDLLSHVYWGEGTPEGVVRAKHGSIYIDELGNTDVDNTTLYLKVSGDNTTAGWEWVISQP